MGVEEKRQHDTRNPCRLGSQCSQKKEWMDEAKCQEKQMIRLYQRWAKVKIRNGKWGYDSVFRYDVRRKEKDWQLPESRNKRTDKKYDKTKSRYRLISDILWGKFQITAIQWISWKIKSQTFFFFWFPVHIKACLCYNVVYQACNSIMSKKSINHNFKNILLVKMLIIIWAFSRVSCLNVVPESWGVEGNIGGRKYLFHEFYSGTQCCRWLYPGGIQLLRSSLGVNPAVQLSSWEVNMHAGLRLV